jgi:hypothetical protein
VAGADGAGTAGTAGTAGVGVARTGVTVGTEVAVGRAEIVARTRLCTVASSPVSSAARAVACSAAWFGPPAVHAAVASASSKATAASETDFTAAGRAEGVPRVAAGDRPGLVGRAGGPPRSPAAGRDRYRANTMLTDVPDGLVTAGCAEHRRHQHPREGPWP